MKDELQVKVTSLTETHEKLVQLRTVLKKQYPQSSHSFIKSTNFKNKEFENMNIPAVPLKNDWRFVNKLKKPFEFYFLWDNPVSEMIDIRTGLNFKGGIPDTAGRLESIHQDIFRYFVATSPRRTDSRSPPK